MINVLLNRKRKNVGRIKIQNDKGKMLEDHKQVSQRFNEYFTSIAQLLKSEIDTKNSAEGKVDDFRKTLPNETAKSIFISSVTGHEVFETINL